MSNPLVSVCIPTYKRLTSLQRAVDSVMRQTYRNWELIVSDDECPGGDTWNYLRKIADTDERIRVVQHEAPHGQVFNVNNTLSLARGEWIKPLFDDDLLLDDCLAEFVKAVEPYTNVVLARCLAKKVHNGVVSLEKSANRAMVEIVEQRYSHLAMFLEDMNNSMTPVQMFIRRTAIENGAVMPTEGKFASGKYVACVDTIWHEQICRYGDTLHLAKVLMEDHQDADVASGTRDTDDDAFDSEMLECKRREFALIPDGMRRPPLKAGLGMKSGIRGLYRIVVRREFVKGIKLLARAWRPVSMWLVMKWCLRKAFPGRFLAVPRIRAAPMADVA